MKAISLIFVMLISVCTSVSHATVIFITEKDVNGNVTSLLGADNVEVNEVFYDVRFVDGTCISVFDGCNGTDDFMFSTFAAAVEASKALSDQVFRNVADVGDFDSTPSLTNGCDELDVCNAYTPYALSFDLQVRPIPNVLASIFDNAQSDEVDSVVNGVGVASADFDFSASGLATWAVWTKVVEASAPSTAIIMLMGIGGLLVFRRTKQS